MAKNNRKTSTFQLTAIPLRVTLINHELTRTELREFIDLANRRIADRPSLAHLRRVNA